jgi:protoporphyrinogen oxidase
VTNPSSYITILGGGPGGLAVGYFARRNGLSFTLYEASDRTGGNAITLEHNGFRFDSGAHRFHDKDPGVTREVKQLLGDSLKKISAPSQIYTEGKFIDFPLSPFNLFIKLGPITFARASFDLLASRLKTEPASPTFENLAVRTYGQTIADRFLLSYTEKLWGRPCDQLSPNISGRRLQGLNFSTLIKELFLGKRAKVGHLEGKFYYPELGYGGIVETLSEKCGDENLKCDARITRLNHRDGIIKAIEINGILNIEVDQVVSTLPLPILLNILDPAPEESILELANQLSFRNLIIVVVMLKQDRITNNASIYIPDPQMPFTRIYEPKNRSSAMSPPGMTSLCVEIPCGPKDELWALPEKELIEIVHTGLERLGLFQDGEVIDNYVHRMSHAYPILEVKLEEKIDQLHSYLTRFSNLKVLGRNGKFLYTHLHDMLRFGMDVIQEYG